jgi:hypothetical protein
LFVKAPHPVTGYGASNVCVKQEVYDCFGQALFLGASPQQSSFIVAALKICLWLYAGNYTVSRIILKINQAVLVPVLDIGPKPADSRKRRANKNPALMFQLAGLNISF